MIITADNTLIPTSSSITADDDDSGYDGNYDYDSDTSQSPPRRRKCLVCHKRIWNDDYDGPDAAAVKKRSCTWNYKEAPIFNDNDDDFTRMPFKHDTINAQMVRVW